LNPYKDEITGSEVSVVGAGGGARAVIYTLIRYFRPGLIHIINRNEQRAESLKRYFRDKIKFTEFTTHDLFPNNLVDVFSGSKLIVNATPVGMFPNVDDSITPLQNSFNKNQIVFDLVYNPAQTKLLKMAALSGAVTLDGLKMLVYQAAKAFEMWTGEDLPIEQLHKSLQLVISD